MIKGTPEFTICPDDGEAARGCEFCGYCKDREICTVFLIFGKLRLSRQCNFCPLTGELMPGWSDKPDVFAIWPEFGTKLQIRSINSIKQKALYTFEALCIFEDKTSAWVPFDYIKNEEEQ